MKIIPKARSTDPETSHAAAESVRETSTRNREAVYQVLRAFGPCTDEQLIRVYAEIAFPEELPTQSVSGLRTRRSELVKQGRVHVVGITQGDTGRMMRVWGVRNSDQRRP